VGKKGGARHYPTTAGVWGLFPRQKDEGGGSHDTSETQKRRISREGPFSKKPIWEKTKAQVGGGARGAKNNRDRKKRGKSFRKKKKTDAAENKETGREKMPWD